MWIKFLLLYYITSLNNPEIHARLYALCISLQVKHHAVAALPSHICTDKFCLQINVKGISTDKKITKKKHDAATDKNQQKLQLCTFLNFIHISKNFSLPHFRIYASVFNINLTKIM